MNSSNLMPTRANQNKAGGNQAQVEGKSNANQLEIKCRTNSSNLIKVRIGADISSQLAWLRSESSHPAEVLTRYSIFSYTCFVNLICWRTASIVVA
jgi:hypothetical protein